MNISTIKQQQIFQAENTKTLKRRSKIRECMISEVH
jgi:hypothetical protein